MAITEKGKIGQNRYGGVFHEEFLRELQGAKGINAFKEMSENDDVAGAVLLAIEMLLRQAEWRVEPAGGTEADQRAAKFVEECLQDMEEGWTDILSEILSFLTYGWSALEIVYKRRNGRKKNRTESSKYNDGLIGWAKLPPRSQESLWQWEYDENDNLTGLTQMPAPTFEKITIPIEKLLLFRTRSRKNNPEGRSILRNAYRSWYFKKRIQEIEGIGVERDLAGLPVLKPKDDIDVWGTDEESQGHYAAALEIVSSIRRDEMEGVVLNPGWDLTLLSTGGSRQFDTNAIIERYDTRIAMTALADFILIGHQQAGSFALSSNKTHMFSLAIAAYLDNIADTFNNQAIPTLIDINGDAFKGMTDYPKMVHGDVEDPDITALGGFINQMIQAEVIKPGPALDSYVRGAANIPEEEKSEKQNLESSQEKPNQADATNETEDVEDESPTKNEEDLQKENAVAKAKNFLGRL